MRQKALNKIASRPYFRYNFISTSFPGREEAFEVFAACRSWSADGACESLRVSGSAASSPRAANWIYLFTAQSLIALSSLPVLA